MMNGAKKVWSKQFDQTMEFNGGAIMPIPLKMLPCIQIGFLPQLLFIFDLEADRISSLSIDPSIVESERGVVLVNVVQVLKILLGDCCRNPCRQLLFKNIPTTGR
jgi:hypothetical protein